MEESEQIDGTATTAPAEENLLKADGDQEASDSHFDSLAVTTPSISMSAGADPWADPSAFAPHVNEMRKPTRDNPWATGSPAPERIDGQGSKEAMTNGIIPDPIATGQKAAEGQEWARVACRVTRN